MDCGEIAFSGHAFERMFARGIRPDEVSNVVGSGTVIADYPEDKPFPSFLLMGWVGRRPLHVVVARDAASGRCHAITAYEPDPAIWDGTFTRRKA